MRLYLCDITYRHVCHIRPTYCTCTLLIEHMLPVKKYKHSIICCILETLPHRLCNNNITDVAQEVMLHNYATYFALGKMLSIQ